MSKNKLPVLGEKSFEELKHFNQHAAEYWNVREIQPMLGYSQWRRFEDAIKRAMVSCEKSGNILPIILPAPAKCWISQFSLLY